MIGVVITALLAKQVYSHSVATCNVVAEDGSYVDLYAATYHGESELQYYGGVIGGILLTDPAGTTVRYNFDSYVAHDYTGARDVAPGCAGATNCDCSMCTTYSGTPALWQHVRVYDLVNGNYSVASSCDTAVECLWSSTSCDWRFTVKGSEPVGLCGDVDFDSDGVFDDCDNCPNVFNPEQVDADGDGIGDLCDNCVLHENPDQIDVNGDGIGDACDVPPDCSAAYVLPKANYGAPFNHKMITVAIGGVTDVETPDDMMTYEIISIHQDEAVCGDGSGGTNVADAICAIKEGTQNQFQVRRERSGSQNGRFYYVVFKAYDNLGQQCGGAVTVGIGHDESSTKTFEGDGAIYYSCDASSCAGTSAHSVHGQAQPDAYQQPPAHGNVREIDHVYTKTKTVDEHHDLTLLEFVDLHFQALIYLAAFIAVVTAVGCVYCALKQTAPKVRHAKVSNIGTDNEDNDLI